ncbi:Protein of unknown function [Gryllus bimaculatus]|nr:Protein of unknown function [Gryllus bimaculatus]
MKLPQENKVAEKQGRRTHYRTMGRNRRQHFPAAPKRSFRNEAAGRAGPGSYLEDVLHGAHEGRAVGRRLGQQLVHQLRGLVTLQPLQKMLMQKGWTRSPRSPGGVHRGGRKRIKGLPTQGGSMAGVRSASALGLSCEGPRLLGDAVRGWAEPVRRAQGGRSGRCSVHAPAARPGRRGGRCARARRAPRPRRPGAGGRAVARQPTRAARRGARARRDRAGGARQGGCGRTGAGGARDSFMSAQVAICISFAAAVWVERGAQGAPGRPPASALAATTNSQALPVARSTCARESAAGAARRPKGGGGAVRASQAREIPTARDSAPSETSVSARGPQEEPVACLGLCAAARGRALARARRRSPGAPPGPPPPALPHASAPRRGNRGSGCARRRRLRLGAARWRQQSAARADGDARAEQRRLSDECARGERGGVWQVRDACPPRSRRRRHRHVARETAVAIATRAAYGFSVHRARGGGRQGLLRGGGEGRGRNAVSLHRRALRARAQDGGGVRARVRNAARGACAGCLRAIKASALVAAAARPWRRTGRRT